MKKNKEWLKEELTKQIDILHTTISSGNYVKLVKRAEIMGLIDQLYEPELPVIPQFVADYVESKDGWTAFEIFYDIDDMTKLSEPISEWMYDNDKFENSNREILLLECVRGDYTIEKEKQYRVVFHSLTGTEEHFLVQGDNGIGGFWLDGDWDYIESSDMKALFTEQEIKAIDERYWAFREEVPNV